MNLDDKKIAVIGLGYVGLPLAVEFAKKRPVLGFDISKIRIDELQQDFDSTLEVSSDELREASEIEFTADREQLKSCDIFIVTVPTPIDGAKRPDLTPLEKASQMVGAVMPKDAVVIYESTVYPGCTKEVCVPILSKESGLVLNETFFVGYSPERINPGDKNNRLPGITKITSGSTPQAAEAIDALYSTIITAGTHKASSIEVAEAAKVIENTQRDLNIALMNEFAVIFNKLGIDTHEVLAAAGTKWNFLPFTPGLVGGHCISVDPYYLTHRAQQIGYHPEVILAGRKINDSMGAYVANQVTKLMMQNSDPVVGSNILVMGLTFKENCPDLRNTRVIDIIETLQEYNANVEIWDPWAEPQEAQEEYGIKVFKEKPDDRRYQAIIIAVGHNEFLTFGAEGIKKLGKENCVIFDVKNLLKKSESTARL